jgi:serine/threonine protein kinase
VSHNKNGYLIDFGKVKQIANASGKKYAKVYNYIAPEVLNSHPPSPACDVYLFGIIIKAIRETIGHNTLLEQSSAIPAQRPSMIRLLSTLIHIHIHIHIHIQA